MSRDSKLYGRNRDSIADLDSDLHTLFLEHPDSTVNDEGQPVIPATALLDVFGQFAEMYDGMELLSQEEMGMLQELLKNNPGIQVTPQVALGFIAQRTAANEASPPRSPPMREEELRGRQDERNTGSDPDSRSSSSDSTGTSRNHSRPPSRGAMPQTPKSGASPFDASRRQRSTPLSGNAPSSWSAKRPPHHRRKSDAGSRSDSEQMSAGPSAFGRPAGRIRAPSNPTSPSTSMVDDFNDPSSPPQSGRFSRPSSRNQGRRQLDEDLDFTLRQGLNSLPMPRNNDSDSDSDDEARVDMIMDRSAASSTVSMMPQDRLDALQRINEDLARKLMEAERTMQRKMAEHESLHEELQMRLDEVNNELSAAKREEKELRAKERTNHQQIQQLETEVNKITRQLEAAKASYSNLQKQYQDQLAMTDRYRLDLRDREDSMRTERETTELAQLEVRKLKAEHDQYELRISSLEEELALSQQAQIQLDEQKQENLMLKETIDRMRFDLDEMRSSNAGALGGSASAQSSAPNTISKSLGAELLGKMKTWGGMEDEEEAAPATNEEDEDTEGEDVVQTIITRKKRKVPSKATDTRIPTMGRREFEERKEYSDMETQYDLEWFYMSSKAQTDPELKVLTASLSTQTDPEPEPVQTLPNTVEMEIQTEPEPSTSAVPADAPPAYRKELTPEEQEEHDWRVTVATLKKHHPGARLEEGVPEGISLDALEDWRALKEELGVSCNVIDKIMENSPRTGIPRVASDMDDEKRPTRRSRLYNIYNTYVYGSKAHPHSNASPFPAIPPPVWWVGATVLAVLALGPSLMIPYYTPPGGPTAYDRAVFNSFNTLQYNGEGFTRDGAGPLWGVLGRVGGGAVRNVRGWPA
ncbi:hypothetical protein MKEN_00420500 [Mycena kentingensis (nom. inval.)]|nr:hypothetical protein MKEN_00420500 [Mycena kentingensis (nom. inval.)]